MKASEKIFRQIIDIQAQCDRMIQTENSLEQYYDLEKYNSEIKKFILENFEDELIINHTNSIPSLSQSLSEKSEITILEKIISFTENGEWQNSGLEIDLKNRVKEMKNKYASLEFLLKNCLE